MQGYPSDGKSSNMVSVKWATNWVIDRNTESTIDTDGSITKTMSPEYEQADASGVVATVVELVDTKVGLVVGVDVIIVVVTGGVMM